VVAALCFHEEHFVILMMTTALLLMVAALGLTIQFGYAGVVNFAGAAFLGVGCYTAGVITKYTALPSFITLPLGGLMAALIGSILILQVLPGAAHPRALRRPRHHRLRHPVQGLSRGQRHARRAARHPGQADRVHRLELQQPDPERRFHRLFLLLLPAAGARAAGVELRAPGSGRRLVVRVRACRQ